jgi:hypothetical protein
MGPRGVNPSDNDGPTCDEAIGPGPGRIAGGTGDRGEGEG